MRLPAGNLTLCDSCGSHANAVWHGHGHIAICATCAPYVLGSLFADAVQLVGANADNVVKRQLAELELAYWRAATLRLLRETRGDVA